MGDCTYKAHIKHSKDAFEQTTKNIDMQKHCVINAMADMFRQAPNGIGQCHWRANTVIPEHTDTNTIDTFKLILGCIHKQDNTHKKV